MCELLSMSARGAAAVNFSLDEFSRHGGFLRRRLGAILIVSLVASGFATLGCTSREDDSSDPAPQEAAHDSVDSVPSNNVMSQVMGPFATSEQARPVEAASAIARLREQLGEALRRALASAAVHVGDLRRTDVAGARAVGMGTIRIRA